MLKVVQMKVKSEDNEKPYRGGRYWKETMNEKVIVTLSVFDF